jgi:SAM-dependent methyltransferase
MSATKDFIDWLRPQQLAHVLELGTKRSVPTRSTVHRDWAHAEATFVRSDFQKGEDVDVLADIHDLSSAFSPSCFDAVIACSVFEHVQRPWIAAGEIAKVLRPGGRVFVQTHFAFPLHSYPHDYWRFTTDALKTIFEDAGLTTLATDFQFPCQIISERTPQSSNAQAFLNSNIMAGKS